MITPTIPNVPETHCYLTRGLSSLSLCLRSVSLLLERPPTRAEGGWFCALLHVLCLEQCLTQRGLPTKISGTNGWHHLTDKL